MTQRLGIGLIPETNVLAELVRVRQQIGACGVTGPSLGLGSNLPHISLFQGKFDDAVRPKRALYELKQYVERSQQRLTVTWRDVVYQPVNWLFLLCDIAKVLCDAQQLVVQQLAPHLTPDAVDVNRNLVGLTPAERDSYVRTSAMDIGMSGRRFVRMSR